MRKKTSEVDTRRHSRAVVDGLKQTPSRAMLRAAKESGRVVQVGLHRRIGPQITDFKNERNFLSLFYSHRGNTNR